MPLETGTQLGPYVVVAPLAAGGMGEVYRAKDARLDRQVAIKVLPTAFAQDADRLARFEREAKAVAALSHPNILSIFDFGIHDGRAYAVTELLDGETLRARLEGGALPVRKTLDYAGQIARGLAAAHDKGVVHRDLKPENIFVLHDGRVKILDFGLARQTIATSGSDATRTVAALTDPGTVMGTVGYMSPEQVRGQAVDGRTDLFSLGAVLYEMLAGQRAFQRDTAADTMTAILKEDPPELGGTRLEIPPALERIVDHCLEKNALERFQSARDVAFALEALSGSTTSAAKAIAPLAASGRVARLARIGALVLVAAVAGGFVGRALTPRGTAPLRFTMKTFEPQTIVVARFMPDGQTIVFSSARSGNAVQLFVIRSGTLEARPMGPPGTHLLAVSSKGELAVLTGARYLGQRLYAGTLARMGIEGSPRPWMEGVREADWSPDGSALAIVHDLGSKDRLEYPIGTVLYETAGYVSDPRVSPDGTRVAFMDHPARYDDRGWVKLVDRSGKVTTLAGEFWGEEGLAWSPDGSRVFFGANDRRGDSEAHAGDLSYQLQAAAIDEPGKSAAALTSPGDFAIHDIAADGRWLACREDIRLGVGVHLASERADRDLSWLHQNWGASLTRDGTRLLFSDGTVGDNYGVVWRKTDGSPIVRLGEGNTLGWSPDESWALAQIFSPPELVLYPVGAGDPVRLKRAGIQQYERAFWFPDGKSLLIIGNEASKPMRAYRQDISGGDPVPLLDEGVAPGAITPDGQTILGVDRDHGWRWYPVAGGAARPALGLTAADRAEDIVGWSEDHKSFFVRRGQDVPTSIDRVEVATGRREPLAQIGPADSTGLYRFLPVSISRDGAQYAYQYGKRLSTLFVVSRER
ncbi:MAG TPA: protein kinase [Candidatus Polarisedimenticolaceae bacterium]|nr:protein kinase [Candidatus Polarisedimenticolaceae bacterium]